MMWMTGIGMPMATVGSLINNAAKSTNVWGTGITTLIGYLILIIGVASCLLAINDIRKHQPSGTHWIVGILAICLGGYFSKNGFGGFTQFAQHEGSDSLDSALQQGKG